MVLTKRPFSGWIVSRIRGSMNRLQNLPKSRWRNARKSALKVPKRNRRITKIIWINIPKRRTVNTSGIKERHEETKIKTLVRCISRRIRSYGSTYGKAFRMYVKNCTGCFFEFYFIFFIALGSQKGEWSKRKDEGGDPVFDCSSRHCR